MIARTPLLLRPRNGSSFCHGWEQVSLLFLPLKTSEINVSLFRFRRRCRFFRRFRRAYRLAFAAFRPGVRPRALSAHGKVAPVPVTAVRAYLYESLYVLLYLAPEVALYLVALLDQRVDLVDLFFRKVLD